MFVTPSLFYLLCPVYLFSSPRGRFVLSYELETILMVKKHEINTKRDLS